MDTCTTIQRLAAERLDIPTETLLHARTLREAGIDSLATIDLIADIETRFAIAIAPEDLEGVQSLQDLAAVVDRLAKRKSPAYEEALA
jgi:acyl carrier protein